MELELSAKNEKCFMGDVNPNNQSLLLSSTLMDKKRRMEECLAVNDQVVRRLLATSDSEEQSSLFHRIDFVQSTAAGGTATTMIWDSSWETAP